MSLSKVVKIKDVHGAGVIQSHHLKTDEINVYKSNDFEFERHFAEEEIQSLGCSFSCTTDDTIKSASFLTPEERNGQYMPANWPTISQLLRRRSCELTKSSSPCVNKAVAHLELIQIVIDEWNREKRNDIYKTESSITTKKQLHFGSSQQNIPVNNVRDVASSGSHTTVSSDMSQHSLLGLEIQGAGAKMEQTKSQETLVIPFLGAEDVIEEVVTLLARLECDRQETEKTLEQEKKRAASLKFRVDRIYLKRMEELPLAVQKEHEACILDLNELQWHVAYSSRNESRMNSRASIAVVLNERLKEDIAFVQKHIPLVQEKLELELEAMQKIRTAQLDTNTEHENANSRQIKTESKSSEAQAKADKEKQHITKELDLVKAALVDINVELSDAKMASNTYDHEINDIHQQLKDNKQEIAVLEVKKENAKVGEEMKSIKVRELQTKITESEFEHEHLEAENQQLAEESAVRKKTNDYKLEELIKATRYKDRQLQQLTRQNREAEMEVDELMDSIIHCKEQQKKDAKNSSRIHKEMGNLQQQLSVTMEEYNRVQSINIGIRDQLQTEEERAFQTEEKLKSTAETLRKQVKDEMQTRSVIQARIHSDEASLTSKKSESRRMSGKTTKVAETVVAEVHFVEKKVERLRSSKNEITVKKANLKQQLEQLKIQQESSFQKFECQIKAIAPLHAKLKDECLKQEKKVNEAEWKKEKMLKELEVIDGSQGAMDRMISATQKTVHDLEEQLEELNIQLNTARKIEDDLKHELNDVMYRLNESDLKHVKFLEDRDKVLQNTDAAKKENLKVNKDKASTYRKLQNQYFALKEQYLQNFEERVKIENQIKDSNQIHNRQTRLIESLLEYFKYKGLYNKSELKRMECESTENCRLIMDLKEEMDTALNNISEFVQTQLIKVSGPRTAFGPVPNLPTPVVAV